MKTSIEINPDACIGCRYCAIICPEGVLALRSEVLAIVVSLENCTACKACEEGCPENAIKVAQQ